MTAKLSDEARCWPALPFDAWKDTCETLHMWTQVVGKVRLALTPLVNHWWNVPLYVTARGLTTSRIPYGARAFELTFDFLARELVLETSEGTVKTLALKPQTVADFYRDCMEMLRGEGIEVKIWHMPVEVANPIPFDEDTVHASYDAEKGGAVLADFAERECGVRAIPVGIHREGEPGAFFLGEFRSGGVAVFGTQGAGAAGSGCDHARGVFA